MTTDNTSRQPKGVPVGGQFAAGTHAESDVSLKPATARIMATVNLQKWVNNDAEHVDQVAFDASRILAGLTTEKRAEIEDCDYSADDVFHAAVAQGLVPEHNGPFAVYLRDAIDDAERRDPQIFEKLSLLPDNRPADATLETPLTAYEIGARADENGMVSGLARMHMSDLINKDLEGHCDQIGEDLVGSPMLMEASATPVSVLEGGVLLVRLDGNASAIIDDFDEDEQAEYNAGRTEHLRR